MQRIRKLSKGFDLNLFERRVLPLSLFIPLFNLIGLFFIIIIIIIHHFTIFNLSGIFGSSENKL